MKTEVVKNILKRRSTRIYQEKQLQDAEVHQIIEAGLYAPSAHNCQSWHFTVIQNKEMITKLNQEFRTVGKTHEIELIQRVANLPNYNIFHSAPTIIIVSGEVKGIQPLVNCAAATQNMLLAAESLDIGSCWIGFAAYAFEGENSESLKAELQIPEGYKPYYAISLGYKKKADADAPKRREGCVTYIK